MKRFFVFIYKSHIMRNLLGMLLFIVLVIVALAVATSVYTRHGETVSIPDVSHMSAEDAFLTLEHAGLMPIVADSGYNRTMAAGAILLQQPAASAVVKAGREVYLTVNSTSSPTLILPRVADNCDVNEAVARLSAMGFKVGPNEYMTGDKDWVLAVKCRGREIREGDRVPSDAVITLVVGNTDIEQAWDEMYEEEEKEAESTEYGNFASQGPDNDNPTTF